MRTAIVTSQTFLLISLFIVSLSNLLVYTGCEPPQADIKSPAQTDKTSLRRPHVFLSEDRRGGASATDAQDFGGYAPAKVDIMPLTEFILAPKAEDSPKLRIYISLLDSFNCQMKSPGLFRFELYEQVLRSPEPEGRRVAIWPDIDLTDAAKNNQYWQDFLRAYEFNLDFEPKANQSYILQATFLTPDGRRLSAEFIIKSR